MPKPIKPAKKHAFGWNCKTCGFGHTVPAPRCVMCGELRGATRQEMVDFVLGKKVAPPVLGNCVELLESPDSKPAAKPSTTKTGSDPNTLKENRHNHRAPPSLPKPTLLANNKSSNINPYFKPQKSTAAHGANNRARVQNPYFVARQQPEKQPKHNASVAQNQPFQQQQQQQQPPKTNTAVTENKEQQKAPPTKPHSFFDKNSKKSKGRRKSVLQLPFQPGVVPHDEQAARTYIYPQHPDFPTRNYQLEITETALNYNTLVSLPTGLGKTHIAAVVMFNYFRWFSSPRGRQFGGKIVFLAPTLPLVHQQIEACYNIMGIPGDETAVLTGKLKASERKELWKTKRVFYCTPQTVQKDIMSACGIGDPKSSNNEDVPETDPDTVAAFSRVVCLVLDEAHKATGEYSYTKVIDLLTTSIHAKFRILGLSATPGKTIQAVQGVITALKSCKIEARTDSDPSVAPYLHTKRTEIVVCPRNTSQIQISRKLSGILQPLLERLREEGGLHCHGNETMVPYAVLKARQTYETNCRVSGRRVNGGLISTFHAAHTLVTIRNDCHQQGLGVVKTKILRLQNGPKRGVMSTICKSEGFSEAVQMVLDATSTEGSCADVVDPKLSKLCELLKHHFERNNACNHSSRAIVFAQFRDAVKEIVDCLESTLKPLVRSRYFVGQNKGSDKTDEKVQGMNQADQQRAIKDFRNDIFNVLVCTSIGEEGLDIGDVDLIINYDVISSPIRTIQRAGRTGRKRDGRVVSLISEGAEEKTHKKRLASEKTLVNALKNPKKFIMESHHPMLPHVPEKEFRQMEIQTKLALSQVAGAQQAPGISKRATAEKKKHVWRLDASEEYERENLCGSIVYLQSDVTWERLRGFFCKNRVDPTKLQGGRRGNRRLLLLDKDDRKHLLKKRNKIRRKRVGNYRQGRIAGILDYIQRFGPLHFESTTRSGYKDILSIFPVDPLEKMKDPNIAPNSNILMGDSNSNTLGESHRSFNDSFVPNPTHNLVSESKRTFSVLEEHGAENHSHLGSRAADIEMQTKENSNLHAKSTTDIEKIQASSIVNEPKSAASEAIAFRLDTPPPSSDEDSSAAGDVKENDGFRLPTQSSSSESSDDEDEECDDHNLNPTSSENKLISVEKSTSLAHQTSFEKDSHQDNSDTQNHLQNENNDKLAFRFPTPPPSSSSCCSEEEDNDDSDTITVPEPRVTTDISSMNADRNGVDTHGAKANKYVTKELSPVNQCSSSTIINLDETFKSTDPNADGDMISIPAGSTPKQKVSVGFDDENDAPLSSLKCKPCSKSAKKDADQMKISDDMSEEDVPLISLSNRKKKPTSVTKKLVGDFPPVATKNTNAPTNESPVEKQLPSGVSLGKSPWKENGGVDDSDEDTPLISLSNKKKKRSNPSQKLSYDIALIDLCSKKVKNSDPSKNKQLLASLGRNESIQSDGKNIHLSTDQTSTQSLSQHDIIDHSKSNQTRTKRPRILETPESHSGSFQLNLSLASTQERSQNDIVDHSKKAKSYKRLRIGSEDSCDKENYGVGSSKLMDPENIPQPSRLTPPTAALASGVLEDTPQTSTELKSEGIRRLSASDLTDTPVVNTVKNVAGDIKCEVCASGDSTCTNPLVLCDGCNLGFHINCYRMKVDIESEEPWYCNACVGADKKKSELNGSPQPKKLYKKITKTSSKASKSISWSAKATSNGEIFHLADSDDEAESPNTKKHRLRERRRRGLAKFVLDEAEIGSDQEDDADEEEEVRRIEEEEEGYSQDSFINDNDVLTQHYSQDILGEIDPDASSQTDNAVGTPGIDPRSHRALDARRERENLFKTPNFNRRMMRPTQDSSSTPSSAQGLGNMNFIRSVLEHHRNGGNCDQIEAEYKRIEASSAAAEAQRNNEVPATTPTATARNLNDDNEYVDLTTPSPPDNNSSSEKTESISTITNTIHPGNNVGISGSDVSRSRSNNGNPYTTISSNEGQRPAQQQPPKSSGLTKEQLARMEANRQAALRRRAELLAKKQQNFGAKR